MRGAEVGCKELWAGLRPGELVAVADGVSELLAGGFIQPSLIRDVQIGRCAADQRYHGAQQATDGGG